MLLIVSNEYLIVGYMMIYLPNSGATDSSKEYCALGIVAETLDSFVSL